MNKANMRKPIRLYTPEHAMSMAKGMVAPLGRVIVMIGLPYSLESVEGTPTALMRALAATELATDKVDPSV